MPPEQKSWCERLEAALRELEREDVMGRLLACYAAEKAAGKEGDRGGGGGGGGGGGCDGGRSAGCGNGENACDGSLSFSGGRRVEWHKGRPVRPELLAALEVCSFPVPCHTLHMLSPTLSPTLHTLHMLRDVGH